MGCAASTPNDRPPARARAEEPAPPAPAPAPPAPQLQSQEVLQDALAAVAARDGEVCALVAVTDAAALKAAYVASVAGGGPLAGVLCVLKDNIGAAGTATAASTPALLESNHAPPSAAVWTRLEAAGAVLLGKANMPELAGASCGYNPVRGHARNPHAVAYSPGGSSSGTAAALGAGYARCGLGTDTAGSLRVPADWCGVAGLRPSLGRYPLEGVVPLMQIDTPGPMAITVKELALLDAVIVGDAEPGDVEGLDLAGKTILAPARWAEGASAGTLEALALAKVALEARGAIVVDDSEGHLAALEAAVAACTLLGPKTRPPLMRRLMREYLEASGAAVSIDEFVARMHETSTLLKMGLTSPPACEWDALSADELTERLAPYDAEVADITAKMAEMFAATGAVAMLTPCTLKPPPNCVEGEASYGVLEAKNSEAAASGDMMAAIGANLDLKRMRGWQELCSRIPNDLPVPSLAVPTAARHEMPGGERLPAGVLLWGPPRADRALLAVGVALEEALAA